MEDWGSSAAQLREGIALAELRLDPIQVASLRLNLLRTILRAGQVEEAEALVRELEPVFRQSEPEGLTVFLDSVAIFGATSVPTRMWSHGPSRHDRLLMAANPVEAAGPVPTVRDPAMGRTRPEPARPGPGPLFRALGTLLLRVPVLPLAEAGVTAAPAAEDADEVDRLLALVRRLAADPRLREAVAVSSPSLSREVEQVLAGGVLRPAGLRRVALALTKYQLRMSSRPTPFGLLGAVAVAHFGPEPAARLGDFDHRGVRPDMSWLVRLVAEWEREPRVLRGLRVCVNQLCTVRGDRVVLPFVPSASEDDGAGPEVRERTVRCTPVVREVLEWARRPRPYPALVGHLQEVFAGVPEAAVERLVVRLVECEVLLTDLRPPLEAPDPPGHVLDRLPRSLDHPGAARLAEIRSRMRVHARLRVGMGGGSWRELTARMAALGAGEGPAQLDQAVDAEVRLPWEVAHELEAAATVVWRIVGPPPSTYWSRYHEEFLDRYGTGRLVPLRELLDPDVGLGPPAGYSVPAGHRQSEAPAPDSGPERRGLLLSLALDAVRAGRREVVLDDGLVERLAGARSGRWEPSMDLYVQVVARSLDDLRAGAFRLVLMPGTGSRQAGASFGRFAYLLDSAAWPRELRSEPEPGDGPLPVQLEFQGRLSRMGNVSQVPRWLEHRVAVGAFADPGDAGEIPLDDVEIGADDERLYAVSRRLGREIVPTIFHMLNPTNAPNAARLLFDIGCPLSTIWRPFDWGDLEGAAYLPRVRYGRTVLVPARWRPNDPLLLDGALDGPAWTAAFQDWRRRWSVPRWCSLTLVDQRLLLDLESAWHLELLRYELGRDRRAILYEVISTVDDGDPEAAPGAAPSWLRASGGTHAHELVVPMVARRVGATPPTRLAALQVSARGAAGRHLPGGSWIYARLYSSAERQDELLATHLPRLLAGLASCVDRWFFVRYRDPEPHLRLRFHGVPRQLNEVGLPALHAWVEELLAAGLAGRLVLDTFDPELERYGGPQALAAAEAVFTADSRAALELLALRQGARLSIEPVLLAAAGAVEMARAWWEGRPGWMEWLLERYPRSEEHAGAFRGRRQESLALIDPFRAEPVPPFLEEHEAAAAAWRDRAAALAEHGRVVRDAPAAGSGWAPGDEALASLIHMHHNRLVGIDRRSEARALTIARSAVHASRERRRFLS